MLPIRLDLPVGSRNANFVWVEPFLDGLTPYDFTGHDARMQVRLFPGAPGSALKTLAIVSGAGEGLHFVKTRPDAEFDGLRITIVKATLQGLPGLNSPEIGAAQRFSYDLMVTPPTGFEAVWLTGDLILSPGVTV